MKKGLLSSTASSSSSSEDERARRALLAECAVVNLTPVANVRRSPQRDYKRSSTRQVTETNVDETDADIKLRQKAARLLDAYLSSRIDFGPKEETSSASQQPLAITEKSVTVLPFNAGLEGQAALDGFRLFCNSRRGLIRSFSTNDSSNAARKRTEPGKHKRRKSTSNNRASCSDSDSDSGSDEEDNERLARARSVAVDRPLKPLRAHFAQPG